MPREVLFRALGCWQRLFDAEAASLRFAAGGYDDVPEERRPIVLGRIRFPKQSVMTLETNSIERAIAGARFFASPLGADVVAMRCRVVNRCFAADEGQPHELMAALDQDVTVMDPHEAEAVLRREFEGVRPGWDAGRIAAEFLERRLKSKEVLVQDGRKTTRLYGAVSTRSRTRLGWIERPPTHNPPPEYGPPPDLELQLPPSTAGPSLRDEAGQDEAPTPGRSDADADDDSPFLRHRRRSWALLIHQIWRSDQSSSPCVTTVAIPSARPPLSAH